MNLREVRTSHFKLERCLDKFLKLQVFFEVSNILRVSFKYTWDSLTIPLDPSNFQKPFCVQENIYNKNNKKDGDLVKIDINHLDKRECFYLW